MPTALKALLAVATAALLCAVIVRWPISATEERKLKTAAALHVIQTYPPSIELRRRSLNEEQSVITYGVPSGAIPYKNLSEFYSVNPDCCALVERGAEGWQPSLLDRLFGLHSHIVRVRYAIRQTQPDGSIRTIPHETFIVLNRSGKVTHT